MGDTRVVRIRTFNAERTAIVRLTLLLKTGTMGGG